MNIEVTIEKNDYKGLMKAVRLHIMSNKSKLNIKGRLSVIFGGMAAGVVLAYGFRQFGEKLHWQSMAVTLFLTVLLFIFFFIKNRSKMLPNHDGIVIGEHKFSFNENHITDTTKLYETKISWQAFVSFQETGEHFILLMDSCAGYIIPKRDITNTEQQNELRELFTAKVVNA